MHQTYAITTNHTSSLKCEGARSMNLHIALFRNYYKWEGSKTLTEKGQRLYALAEFYFSRESSLGWHYSKQTLLMHFMVLSNIYDALVYMKHRYETHSSNLLYIRYYQPLNNIKKYINFNNRKDKLTFLSIAFRTINLYSNKRN